MVIMKSFHEVLESFRIAYGAVRANKVRGMLTTLGIIIGIVAVVTTMTAANGLGNRFKESISVIGSDVLFVSRTPWIFTGNFFDFRNRKNLTLKDSEKLERQLPAARAIDPRSYTNQSVKYRSRQLENISIIGATDNYVMVSNTTPEYGRFLIANDIQYKKNVCIIGSEIKDQLFKDIDPINKKIKIGRHFFLIVGLMEKQGSANFFGGPNFDRQIVIPISSMMKCFGGTNRPFDIVVKAPSTEEMIDFEYALIGEMRKIRKLTPSQRDDFSINKMDTLMSAYNNVMGVVVLIGLIITSISLFVGGIGVMNIMFVSVTERTREIGIRKAIGATKKTILTQFLFESSSICLLGGLIGLLMAFGVTKLINAFLLPASISPDIVVVALVISIMVGVLSGVIPAYRASRLNPIEALRYE
jgi:putative ABC transport system permease protein